MNGHLGEYICFCSLGAKLSRVLVNEAGSGLKVNGLTLYLHLRTLNIHWQIYLHLRILNVHRQICLHMLNIQCFYTHTKYTFAHSCYVVLLFIHDANTLQKEIQQNSLKV